MDLLYAAGCKYAPQRVLDLNLARSLVCLAVGTLPQVEGAAGKMSAPEAAAAVRKLQLQVTDEPPGPALASPQTQTWPRIRTQAQAPDPDPGPGPDPHTPRRFPYPGG